MRVRRDFTVLLSIIIMTLTVFSNVTLVRAEDVAGVALLEAEEEVGVTSPADGEPVAPEKPEVPETPEIPSTPEQPVVSDPNGTALTYTVEFYVFGELVDKQTVSAGNAVNPPQVATVSTNEAEYHFIRWIRQEDGTEPDLNIINSNLVLVAEFERIPYDEDTGDAPVKKKPKQSKKPTTEIGEGETIVTNSSSGSSSGTASVPADTQKESLAATLTAEQLQALAAASGQKAIKAKEVSKGTEVQEENKETEAKDSEAAEETAAAEEEISEELGEEEETLTRIEEEEVPLAAPDAEPFPFLYIFIPVLLIAGYVVIRRILRVKKTGGTFED